MADSNPSPEIKYVDVAPLESVPEGERLLFDIGEIPIVLFHTPEGFFAIEDNCTHENSPLGDGELVGMAIKCPNHGACFDIRSGAALNLPAVIPTLTFPVRIMDGKIQVGMPATSAD